MHLLTYTVTPFFRHPLGAEAFLPAPTEWLRTAILMLVNRSKARLAREGVSHEIFHNHDEVSGNTIARYPMVLYQHHNGLLYVTGINEGARALEVLISQYERAVEIDRNSLIRFKAVEPIEMEVSKTQQKYIYSLSSWLPFSSQNHKAYQATETLAAKIELLQKILSNHLGKDFGRFFNLDIEPAEVSLLEVQNFKNTCKQLTMNGRKHDFQPFDIKFSTNLILPDFINLGNGKVYGFGLLQRVT